MRKNEIKAENRNDGNFYFFVEIKYKWDDSLKRASSYDCAPSLPKRGVASMFGERKLEYQLESISPKATGI